MTPLRIQLEPEEIPGHGHHVVADRVKPAESCRAIDEALKHLPKVG